VCAVRKLLRKNRDAFIERTTPILLCVPSGEIDFFHKDLNTHFVFRKKTTEHVSRIPIDEDVAKVENDGFDAGWHALILLDDLRQSQTSALAGGARREAHEDLNIL
jgi:hypothetical protein